MPKPILIRRALPSFYFLASMKLAWCRKCRIGYWLVARKSIDEYFGKGILKQGGRMRTAIQAPKLSLSILYQFRVYAKVETLPNCPIYLLQVPTMSELINYILSSGCPIAFVYAMLPVMWRCAASVQVRYMPKNSLALR
jgi:hypothetical protein